MTRRPLQLTTTVSRSKPSTYWHARVGVVWLLSCAALVGGLLSGCAHSTYYASDLPAELQAPPNAVGAAIDLSQFAKPTTANDIVEPGDVLDVSIATGLETRRAAPWELRVDDRGVVMIPIVGAVRIAGMTLTEADQAIYNAAVSRGFYRNPNVAVTRIDRRQSRVIVAGAVKRPGSYDLPASSCDVLSAIVAAGGLDPDADTIVEVRLPATPNAPRRPHGGEQLASYSENAPAEARTVQLDLSQPQHIHDWDVALTDGAVVSVRERPDHMVAVMGKVKKPGQFEMPQGAELNLLDALALAGGRTLEFADKVYVVRQSAEGGDPVLIRASVNDAKGDPAANIRLAPGDLVSVEETPLTMGLGALKSFFRLTVSSRYTLF